MSGLKEPNQLTSIEREAIRKKLERINADEREKRDTLRLMGMLIGSLLAFILALAALMAMVNN